MPESEAPRVRPVPRRGNFPARPPIDEHVGIFQQLVDGLPEQAALVDAKTGKILGVNEAWALASNLNGYADFRPGNNYFHELARLAEAASGPVQATSAAIEEMRQGKRTNFRLVFDGVGYQSGQKFEARIALLNAGGRDYIRIVLYDITELAHLRDMNSGMGVSLMRAQESERRRMARELHDSSMQSLVSLSLSLARLRHSQSDGEVAAITADMEGLLFEAQRELRSISFLSHPPEVEQLGLEEALRALVFGFGKRAGLETSFVVDGTIEDISSDASHTLYRVVQEAISNVHRHARARKLDVRLIGRKWAMHVAVIDDGCGILAGQRHGVGLRSMRSRMRELGGRFSIRDGEPGTIVVASLPMPSTKRDRP